MKNRIKCSHCGSYNIDAEDWFDTDLIFDTEKQNEVILRRMIGRCDECKTTLLWDEIYEYTNYQNVREG